MDFATDIKRLDKEKKPVIFDGECSFTSEEAVNLFKKQMQGNLVNIDIATFIEENLEEDTGYNYISGKFLVISGIKNNKE